MERPADWSALPSELLQFISKKLFGIEDYARFLSVCKSWRSAAVPSNLPRQLPWLTLPPKLPERDGDDAEYPSTRQFFSLADHRLLNLPLPETRNKICYSAGHGWLLAAGRKGDIFSRDPPKDPELFLLNPLTHARIPLPPRTRVLGGKTVPFVPADILGTLLFGCGGESSRSTREMCTWFVDKAVLSSNPATSARWTLAVVLNNSWKLAFYRPGDTSWKVTDHELSLNHFVTHFNGSFYICGCQKILAVDFSSSKEIVYPIREHLYRDYYHNYLRDYLVQSQGQLLLIERYEICTFEGGVAVRKELFDVFKMDSAGEQPSWSPVYSLGDHALFLSHNISLSVSVADLHGRFRPSCIYYTDQTDMLDLNEDDRHIGVFSLEDGSTKLLHCCPDDSPELWKASWFLPSQN